MDQPLTLTKLEYKLAVTEIELNSFQDVVGNVLNFLVELLISEKTPIPSYMTGQRTNAMLLLFMKQFCTDVQNAKLFEVKVNRPDNDNTTDAADHVTDDQEAEDTYTVHVATDADIEGTLTSTGMCGDFSDGQYVDTEGTDDTVDYDGQVSNHESLSIKDGCIDYKIVNNESILPTKERWSRIDKSSISNDNGKSNVKKNRSFSRNLIVNKRLSRGCFAPYRCDVCKYQSASQQCLYRHIQMKHFKGTKYLCKKCSKHSTDKGGSQPYKTISHNQKHLYQCSKCLGKFPYNFIRQCKIASKVEKSTECVKHLSMNNSKENAVQTNGSFKLKCECGKRFSWPSSFEMHKSLCTIGLNRNKSKLYDKNATKENRKQDVKNDNKTYKIFQCDICSYTTKVSTHYTRHQALHSRPSYPCSLCDKVYSTKGLLNQHKNIIHQGHKPTCQICSKEFLSQQGLSSHMKLEHGKGKIKSFICHICDKAYTTKHNFVGHMNNHGNSSPFKCNSCSKTFIYESSLNKHIKSCGLTPSLSCPHCEFITLTEERLKDHIRGKHSNTKLQCLCGRIFSWRATLHRHAEKCTVVSQTGAMDTNTSNLMSRTVKTESGFTSRKKHKYYFNTEVSAEDLKVEQKYSNIKKHKATHRQETNLLCEICSTEFKSHDALTRHERLKHGKGNRKLYCCDECGQVFAEKPVYVGHMNVHNNKTPFKCETCFKTFAYVTSLKKHVKTCSEETLDKQPVLHICKVCGLHSKSATQLKDHLRGKHSNNTYICLCGKQFTWRTSFVRHKSKCTYESKE